MVAARCMVSLRREPAPSVTLDSGGRVAFAAALPLASRPNRIEGRVDRAQVVEGRSGSVYRIASHPFAKKNAKGWGILISA